MLTRMLMPETTQISPVTVSNANWIGLTMRSKRFVISPIGDTQRAMGPSLIKVGKPIHELRKVYGSMIATEHGIYAAKELLGHSTIAVTERIYAAYLKQPTVNLGALTSSDLRNSQNS